MRRSELSANCDRRRRGPRACRLRPRRAGRRQCGANELDANMTLEAPANDASAMEAAGQRDRSPGAGRQCQRCGRGQDRRGPGGNNVKINTVGM